MGGGTRYGTDTQKGPARDILADLATSGAPGFRDAVAFCAQVHSVEFAAAEGSSVVTGQRVELRTGVPPELVSGGHVIGLVLGEMGSALNGCLALNFNLTGTVETFDRRTGFGVATLVGAAQRAA